MAMSQRYPEELEACGKCFAIMVLSTDPSLADVGGSGSKKEEPLLHFIPVGRDVVEDLPQVGINNETCSTRFFFQLPQGCHCPVLSVADAAGWHLQANFVC